MLILYQRLLTTYVLGRKVACRERYAANLRRELQRIPFASATTLNHCHPENDCHLENGCHPERSEGSVILLPAEKLQIPHFVRDDKSKLDEKSKKDSAKSGLTGGIMRGNNRWRT